VSFGGVANGVNMLGAIS